jgi:hypothetical protein
LKAFSVFVSELSSGIGDFDVLDADDLILGFISNRPAPQADYSPLTLLSRPSLGLISAAARMAAPDNFDRIMHSGVIEPLAPQARLNNSIIGGLPGAFLVRPVVFIFYAFHSIERGYQQQTRLRSVFGALSFSGRALG